MILLCVSSAPGISLAASTAAPVFKVLDFGAVGDGTTLNTSALQQAIDACSEKGGGIVYVGAGQFVTGTLRMKSHVTLELGEGASLLGSTNLADYSTNIVNAVEAPYFNRCLIYAESASHLAFVGKGCIDGRGSYRHWPVRANGQLAERPMLLRLVNCDTLRFSGISLRNSASWGLHLLDSDKIRLDGIHIDSHANVANNDGVDIDGCQDVKIERCQIFSGDDAICGKSTTARLTKDLTVVDCDVSSKTAAFKLGTSSRGGFVGIQVSNCHFFDCPMGAVKLTLVDGGRLEGVEISNIRMDNVGGPVFIRLGNRGRRYDRPVEQIYEGGHLPEGAAVGVLRNVVIRNIEAKVGGSQRDRQGIMIVGIPGHKVENVRLEDIEITLPGGGTDPEAKRTVPEEDARYPEQFFFGVPPSSFLYARHVNGLLLKNLRVNINTPDRRNPMCVEDGADVSIVNVIVNGKPL